MDAAVRRAAAEAVGSEIRIVGPTARGESRSTFDAVVGDVEVVLKVLASGPGVVENQQWLIRVVRRLRARGYPAPEHLGVGTAGRVVVTAQRRVPGDTLEPGPAPATCPSHHGPARCWTRSGPAAMATACTAPCASVRTRRRSSTV
jgi:hypothetical protein